MPRKKLQVFISSTFLDLQEERQAAVSAILKAGHIPAGMELFTAGDESQWDIITRWIDESDVYMLILGGRYGSVHPVTEQGYTEMEYDYAVSAGKPFFSVVIKEATLDEWVKSKGKEVLELTYPNKLKEFRSKVLSKMSSFFADAKDIKLAIHETIPVLEQKHNPVGWISGSEFTDNKPLVGELSKLGDENRALRKELVSLQGELNKLKAKSGEGDYNELKKTLSEIDINVSAFKEDGGKNPDSISLLQLSYAYREHLASGITNEMGISKFASFMFHTVCPKLQIYELVQVEKVAGVKWRRYMLTSKGRKFFAEFEKEIISMKVANKTKAKKDKE